MLVPLKRTVLSPNIGRNEQIVFGLMENRLHHCIVQLAMAASVRDMSRTDSLLTACREMNCTRHSESRSYPNKFALLLKHALLSQCPLVAIFP